MMQYSQASGGGGGSRGMNAPMYYVSVSEPQSGAKGRLGPVMSDGKLTGFAPFSKFGSTLFATKAAANRAARKFRQASPGWGVSLSAG